jgi:hypothetical protein
MTIPASMQLRMAVSSSRVLAVGAAFDLPLELFIGVHLSDAEDAIGRDSGAPPDLRDASGPCLLLDEVEQHFLNEPNHLGLASFACTGCRRRPRFAASLTPGEGVRANSQPSASGRARRATTVASPLLQRHGAGFGGTIDGAPYGPELTRAGVILEDMTGCGVEDPTAHRQDGGARRRCERLEPLFVQPGGSPRVAGAATTVCMAKLAWFTE